MLIILTRIALGFFAFIGMIAVAVYGYVLATDYLLPRRLLAGCGDPCVIADNPGGITYVFHDAAQLVLYGARSQVIIDGYCASACAYFADKARPKVCITRRARFGFHEGRWSDHELDPSVHLIPRHSADIARWVKRRGGFPEEGMLWMDYKEARRFWSTCKDEE